MSRLSWHAQIPPWNNDPVPCYHDGTYHLFLQHNPERPDFGTMRWGHVTSTDLAHWTIHPEAISPGPVHDTAIWTGSIVRHEGLFHAFYTGILGYHPLTQCQCVATSTDLFDWAKDPANPLIPAPPPGYGECFRDPGVFRWGDEWRMVVGSQWDQDPVVLLYASHDLRRWELLGEAWRGTNDPYGFDAECPDLFPLGDAWVLLTSRFSNHYQVGTFDGERFQGETYGLVDHPADPTAPRRSEGFAPFYAGKTLLDGRGRRLLFGWATHAAGDGWRGGIATPRVMHLRPDGHLAFSVPEELRGYFQTQPDGSLVGVDGPLMELVSPEGQWTTTVAPSE